MKISLTDSQDAEGHPGMAAGLSGHVWSYEKIAGLCH
jgi:hypothetical protein